MIDAKYLDEIKEREQAATSGPWEVKVKGNTVESHQVMSQGNEPICSAISPKTKNAQFIAHARTDIPALIAEVERLTRKLVNQNRRILNRESKKDQQINELKEKLKEVQKELEKYHKTEQWLDDINNPLEPIKVQSALNSEIMKLDYLREHKPEYISELDGTIIAALLFVQQAQEQEK